MTPNLLPHPVLENDKTTLTQGFKVLDFGLANYPEIYQLQKDLVELVVKAPEQPYLLVGEHYPVITLGRGQNVEADLKQVPDGVTVVNIERGGRATYHAPGQLVVYPILKLKKNDLHGYLRALEMALIQTINQATYLNAKRDEQGTGVWVNGFKVASIGVAVKQGVTYHGLALNIETNLEGFGWISPCGMDSSLMNNLRTLTEDSIHTVKIEEIKTQLVSELVEMLVNQGLA